MKRRIGDWVIDNDGTQWIVQKESLGKDKSGNSKMMLGTKHYIGTLKSVAIHINNEMLMQYWDNSLLTIHTSIENMEK